MTIKSLPHVTHDKLAITHCTYFIKSIPSCKSPCTSRSCGLGLFGAALICALTSFNCCSYLQRCQKHAGEERKL
jgi:hypothetical protein